MRTSIPLSVLFGDPERVVPTLSPDATRLAWLAPVDGVLNLHIDGQQVTHEERSLRQYWWSHDGRFVLWPRDAAGDENFHLVALDTTTGNVDDLTPYDGVRCEVVAIARSSGHVAVGLNRRDRRVFDLYRVTLDGGDIQLLAENPDVDDWLVDPELRLLGGMRMKDDGRVELLSLDGGAWRTTAGDVGDYLAALPYGVTSSGDLILRTDKDRSTRGVARICIESGERTDVFFDDTYDVQSVVLHPQTREPQLVVVDRELPTTVVLDPTLADDWERLEALHYGRPVILSRDRVDANWIVGYLSDSGPVAHYRWNRPEQRATFLFDHRPEMRRYEWAAMEPFAFTARDGLTINGYLSYPPGEVRSDLPAVVSVHGGPWRRNVWGFDAEAQWLANRGYVCIQVNFRGSAGYGKEFLDAGDREWGGAMQNDLVDAVDHLARTGVVDRRRVGVMGVSYGGYASLAAITFTDVFACAIARVGPSNLVSFIQSVPPHWQPTVELWHRRVGHPESDREMLEARSPLLHVDQVDAPVLLVHGGCDPRVLRAESDAFAAALASRGVDHEYIVFDDEGHGINQSANRVTFYERAEAFLRRHLG